MLTFGISDEELLFHGMNSENLNIFHCTALSYEWDEDYSF